jgi:hypothetical protein
MVENLDKTSLNFTEALKALEVVSTENFVTNIWVPSKQSEIQVKEINAKQQKKLLQSALEEITTRVPFTEIFYNILSENVLDKDVLKTLTSVDKVCLAIGMRAQISNNLKVELQEDPQIIEEINLQNILKKFKDYKHPTSKKINLNNLIIEVNIPTITTEIKFEQLQSKQKQTNEVDTIKETIVEAFLIETSKYVAAISIGESDIDLSLLTASQRVNLVEKLPAHAIQNILEYVAELKQNIENILMVSNEEHQLSKPVTIDSSLYLNL